MSKYIGRLVQIGIGKESVRGAGASSVYTLPFAKHSFDDKIVQARSTGALGTLEDSEEAFVTTKYGQGDIDAEVRSKSIGFLLYAMLGGLSTSGPTDSAYTHTFSIVHNNQHQSLSFVVEDPTTTELYKLVMLDSLKLTAALDQVINFSAGFLSKTARDTGLTAPAVVSEHKFTKKHINVRFASNIAGLSGATDIALKSLSFNIMKNVSIDDFLGSAEPEDFLNGPLAVEGELELNYDAETYKNYQQLGTNRAMQIAMVNTDATIGAGTRPSLTFQLPKVDFFNWTPNYDIDKIVTQKISFKASRDVSNNLDVISSCILVNDVSSY